MLNDYNQEPSKLDYNQDNIKYDSNNSPINNKESSYRLNNRNASNPTYSVESLQSLIYWINTIKETHCLLAMNAEDLFDGIVLLEILKHFITEYKLDFEKAIQKINRLLFKITKNKANLNDKEIGASIVKLANDLSIEMNLYSFISDFDNKKEIVEYLFNIKLKVEEINKILKQYNYENYDYNSNCCYSSDREKQANNNQDDEKRININMNSQTNRKSKESIDIKEKNSSENKKKVSSLTQSRYKECQNNDFNNINYTNRKDIEEDYERSPSLGRCARNKTNSQKKYSSNNNNNRDIKDKDNNIKIVNYTIQDKDTEFARIKSNNNKKKLIDNFINCKNNVITLESNNSSFINHNINFTNTNSNINSKHINNILQQNSTIVKENNTEGNLFDTSNKEYNQLIDNTISKQSDTSEKNNEKNNKSDKYNKLNSNTARIKNLKSTSKSKSNNSLRNTSRDIIINNSNNNNNHIMIENTLVLTKPNNQNDNTKDHIDKGRKEGNNKENSYVNNNNKYKSNNKSKERFFINTEVKNNFKYIDNNKITIIDKSEKNFSKDYNNNLTTEGNIIVVNSLYTKREKAEMKMSLGIPLKNHIAKIEKTEVIEFLKPSPLVTSVDLRDILIYKNSSQTAVSNVNKTNKVLKALFNENINDDCDKKNMKSDLNEININDNKNVNRNAIRNTSNDEDKSIPDTINNINNKNDFLNKKLKSLSEIVDIATKNNCNINNNEGRKNRSKSNNNNSNNVIKTNYVDNKNNSNINYEYLDSFANVREVYSNPSGIKNSNNININDNDKDYNNAKGANDYDKNKTNEFNIQVLKSKLNNLILDANQSPLDDLILKDLKRLGIHTSPDISELHLLFSSGVLFSDLINYFETVSLLILIIINYYYREEKEYRV